MNNLEEYLSQLSDLALLHSITLIEDKVNSVNKHDSFLLPRMEDCINRVGSTKFVRKLDLLKGY